VLDRPAAGAMFYNVGVLPLYDTIRARSAQANCGEKSLNT
jgi:hypothetical protein